MNETKEELKLYPYEPDYPKDAQDAIEMLTQWLEEDADENTDYLKGYRMALKLGIQAIRRVNSLPAHKPLEKEI